MPLLRVLMLWVAKTFSKLFGVATVTFFGRAPSRDDDKVAAVGLLALLWPFTVVSLAVPGAAEVLIPLAPDDDAALRAISASLVIGVPAIVGLVVHTVQNQPEGGAAALRNVGMGYVYTPVVGALVLAVVVVVPAVKLGYLVRRFELEHLAVMVPEGGYDRLREHIQELLAAEGIATDVRDHPWLLRELFVGLSWAEGHIFRRGLSTRMQRLVCDSSDGWFEVTIHATDLTIVGDQEPVGAVFALLVEGIDPRTAYLSWDDASQRLEDDIARCQDDIAAGEPCDRERVADIAGRLRRLGLSPPEWNAIRGRLYRIEVASERLRAEAVRERAPRS